MTEVRGAVLVLPGYPGAGLLQMPDALVAVRPHAAGFFERTGDPGVTIVDVDRGVAVVVESGNTNPGDERPRPGIIALDLVVQILRPSEARN